MSKRCCSCKKWLFLENFGKDGSRRDGLRDRCKMCRAEDSSKYREKNKKKIAKQKAEYYQNNKEKIAKYHQKNKERIATRKAQYRRDNIEKVREREIQNRNCKSNKVKVAKNYEDNKAAISERAAMRRKDNRKENLKREAEYRKNNRRVIALNGIKYYQNNKEKIYALTAKHRAIKLNQTPASADLKIIQLYYVVCSETNEILGNTFFHVDHIQPLSKDGLHHENNLQILESYLNLQKSDKWPLSSDERLKYSGITL